MSSRRVVLDTDVLASALLNSFGAPGRVLDLVLVGELIVCYDDRVLSEWRDVLLREKFKFQTKDVETLLEFMEDEGVSINSSPLGTQVPDPDDLTFLETAYATDATLITGNLKHYPTEKIEGVAITEPSIFLDRWISKTLDHKPGEGSCEQTR